LLEWLLLLLLLVLRLEWKTQQWCWLSAAAC
jgi:hypothetical protein